MSKKLTPLEALEEIKKYSKVVANSEEIKVIETALIDLEEIKNLYIEAHNNVIYLVCNSTEEAEEIKRELLS